MDGNYEQLVELISTSSGLPNDEIKRRIEAKQAKLSGLISKSGAAQVVAAELNINFDKQEIKINQISLGMRKINVVGLVINLSPIREFNKNGRSGRVVNFMLADNTGNIRVVLWDENHIDLFYNNKIKEGDFVEITNAGLRNGELHLGSFSEIKLSSKVIKDIVLERQFIRKNINDCMINDFVSIRAYIVQMFEPRFFKVCPECKKKVSETDECGVHGKVISDKRVLLNFVIDDGSDSMRTVIFSDDLLKLIPQNELENQEVFMVKKEELIGKEIILFGQVRKNSLYDNNELIASKFQDVHLDSLIKELEA